ncbi:hypothetical protein MKX03_027281 [Papaver bracteatum]|nr:hypothetical protein MKX03_027281 [Papaver bracteatum]
MSWYADPELFLCFWGSSRGYFIDRIVKKYNVPLQAGDVKYAAELDFSKHLSLGNNKESDYDALKSSLAKILPPNTKLVNCQGLVVLWDNTKLSGTWSRIEEYDSSFYSLPGIQNPSEAVLDEKQSVEKKISELVAENSRLNSEIINLQEQLNKEKNAKQELEKQVVDLTKKLEECCGAAGGSTDVQPSSGTWSRVEDHDSIFYSLPGIKNPFDTVLSLWNEKQRNSVSRQKMIRKMFQLVEENSLLKKKLKTELRNLQEQLNQEKNDKQALKIQVFDLTEKLQESRGAGSGSADVEPWMSAYSS